jgi:hypothetical protein
VRPTPLLPGAFVLPDWRASADWTPLGPKHRKCRSGAPRGFVALTAWALDSHGSPGLRRWPFRASQFTLWLTAVSTVEMIRLWHQSQPPRRP